MRWLVSYNTYDISNQLFLTNYFLQAKSIVSELQLSMIAHFCPFSSEK